MSAGIIISLVSSIILLFVSMVLSAMSATSASRGDKDNAHKYATASAVVCGLAVLVLVVVLIIYINQAKILAHLQTRLAMAKDAYLRNNPTGAATMDPSKGYYGEEN
jgi:hypothetical protein